VRQLKKLNIEGVSEHLGTVTPGDRSDFPGLQAADGLAYGSWNIEPHVDAGRIGVIPNPPGTTVAQARARKLHGQKIPYFRVVLDREMLTSYKADLLHYEEFKREYGKRKYGSKKGGDV
jgi:hypothetical protein